MNRLIETHSKDSLRAPVIAWEWEKAGYIPTWHEPLFDLMARYVPGGSRILEVGAGGSHTLGSLARRLGCEAYGIEPDMAGITSTLTLAATEGANVEMVRGDGFVLPFAGDAFDVVYSLGLIEHFAPRESTALLAEQVRVCRPGGRVLVSVPNLLNLPHTLNKLVLAKRYTFYPERSYTPGQLRAALEAAGLRVIASDGLLPLWSLGMIRGGWRVTAALDCLRIAARLNRLESARTRATIGYMTFAVGERPSSH